jgi:hypothetical protein
MHWPLLDFMTPLDGSMLNIWLGPLWQCITCTFGPQGERAQYMSTHPPMLWGLRGCTYSKYPDRASLPGTAVLVKFCVGEASSHSCSCSSPTSISESMHLPAC